ncbi:M28 family metallopeptidase [Nocardioides sp. C4-1]|uniref:M28 family metallopeptidase n=1 Tax=Nocardioides sp. C4-1 TaxID=3151851 RepID=UPI0032675135
MRWLVTVPVVAALLAGCTDDDTTTEPERTSTATTTAPQTTPPPGTPTGGPAAPAPTPPARVAPSDLRRATAVAAVEHLAGTIGPRPGESDAFFRAARWAQGELTSYGWTVSRQRFPSPPGDSWGVAVPGGPSVNLVATQGRLEPDDEWLLVGAHLDTVPQAPGAEDNASGVGVVLALAEALQDRRARLPVVLVLFGSEEPRGPGEAHHYGSKAFVADLTPAQRRGLRGMVSLDRVGVGSVVPVQTVGEPNRVSGELVAAARRVGVPVEEQPGETSSDHESFADEGLPAARLGSTPYAGYHSADDVASVIERDQLARVGRIVLAWLR